MVLNPSTDWSGSRGEKWRRQLDGLEATLRPIDEPLIRALDLDAPYRIADVGCGAGATTLAVHRRAPTGSVVHGFDLSPTLVEAARSRTPAADAVVFRVADMGKTAPPDRLYDRLVSRFGIMFFDDPSVAFANLWQWLVPGGRCAFAVWGPLTDNIWMTTIREAVAGVVDLPRLDPAAPGPFRYGDVSALLALLDDAGFTSVEAIDWQGSVPIGNRPTADAAASFALAAFSSFAELLSEAGPEALPAAHRALTRSFAAWVQGDRVAMPARVHIVTGRAGER